MIRAIFARRHIEGIVRVMQMPETRRKIWKSIFALLPRKQKSGFFLILLILGVSAVFGALGAVLLFQHYFIGPVYLIK